MVDDDDDSERNVERTQCKVRTNDAERLLRTQTCHSSSTASSSNAWQSPPNGISFAMRSHSYETRTGTKCSAMRWWWCTRGFESSLLWSDMRTHADLFVTHQCKRSVRAHISRPCPRLVDVDFCRVYLMVGDAISCSSQSADEHATLRKVRLQFAHWMLTTSRAKCHGRRSAPVAVVLTGQKRAALRCLSGWHTRLCSFMDKDVFYFMCLLPSVVAIMIPGFYRFWVCKKRIQKIVECWISA